MCLCVLSLASYPGLLTPAFVAYSTNAGEGLVKLVIILCRDISGHWVVVWRRSTFPPKTTCATDRNLRPHERSTLGSLGNVFLVQLHLNFLPYGITLLYGTVYAQIPLFLRSLVPKPIIIIPCTFCSSVCVDNNTLMRKSGEECHSSASINTN